MHYTEFRDLIQNELRLHPGDMTWIELRTRLNLLYDQPCQTWVGQLEQEIGLIRERKTGRAYTWKVPPIK